METTLTGESKDILSLIRTLCFPGTASVIVLISLSSYMEKKETTNGGGLGQQKWLKSSLIRTVSVFQGHHVSQLAANFLILVFFYIHFL